MNNQSAIKPPSKTKVIQLIWEGEDGYHSAGTGMGISYAVTEYDGMAKPFKAECRGSYWKGGMFGSLEDAKEAVQNDFERRVRRLIIET